MKRILSVLLVIVLVVSSSGSVAVAQTDIPAGMVGVPDANVSEDVPLDSSPPLRASDLEGSVMASDHAESLEVIVTTPDRASDYLDGGDGTELSGSKGLSLVLQDDVHSAGREVAIDAGAVKDALGFTPERVYGTHEDGEEWSRAIEYQGGMLIFEVPHFSSNSVTFSSEVSVSGSYTDGSSVGYDVSSLDSVSNFSINVTGEMATETDTELISGKSGPVSIAGTTEPVSPSGSGEPVVKVSATTDSISEATESQVDSYSFSSVPSGVSMATLGIGQDTSADDSSETATIWVDIDGERAASREITIASDNDYDIWDISDINEPVDSSVTVGVTASGSDTSDSEVFLSTKYAQYIENSPPSSFTISSSSGQSESVSGYSAGHNVTVTLDLPTGDHTISTDAPTGVWSMSTNYTERVEPIDPTVSVNGNQTGFTGTLSDGETAQLSTSESWVSESNTVNISIGDGSLSADAPSPVVQIDYEHDALDKQAVNYQGTKWTESYNVSKTFASDRSEASLTIPFASEVVEIGSIKKRTNGGSWSSVSVDDRSLNDTELTVHLGSVDGGDTVDIRATGQQVVSINSSITVLEPTAPGDRLDTQVRVDSWDDDASISVGRTEDSGRIHYTYNESWDNADSHVEITADGTQRLYLPGAGSLSEFRVRTVPVRVNARSGEVQVSMRDPSTTEPKFYVSPGATQNDDVEYTLLTASDGEEYILRSETNNVVHDSAEANSPVTLVDDDSEELLIIEQDSTTASEDDGPSQVGIGPAQIDTDTPLNSVPVILLVGAGILVALAVIYRRLGWSIRDATGPVPVDPVFALAAGLIAFVVIDYVGGGVLTSALASNIEQIGSGFSQIVPLLGIGGAALLGYWLYQNYILGNGGGGSSSSSRVRTIVLREGDD